MWKFLKIFLRSLGTYLGLEGGLSQPLAMVGFPQMVILITYDMKYFTMEAVSLASILARDGSSSTMWCWLLWHFQVRAVCKVSASIPENVETLVEESQLWSTLSFTTRPSTPDPPGVNSQTESTIKILWRAAQGSNTSFEVEYGRDGSSHRRHTKGNSLTLTGTVDCPSGTTIIPHHIYHASSTASCKKWWKVIGRVSQKVTKL